jgi:molybdopterin converting factor small subunit
MAMPSTTRYQRFLVALRQNVRVFDAAEHDEQRLAAASAVLQGEVEVNEGVKDGDKVILQPPVNLADGNKVQIIPEPPAAAP